MHNAATMAGLAFGNSQAGATHSLGHSLGAIFHVPHGRTMALFLPYVIEYSAREVKGRYAEIAEAIGIRAESVDEAVEKLVESIRGLFKEIGEPMSVRELSISWEEYQRKLDELADKANRDACTFVNPRVPDLDEFKKLFVYAFEGKRIDF
jgi:alcohol dehydrogenase class IV